MNILDIQNRLRQLNAIKYLSDEEIEEKERLMEELALQRGSKRNTLSVVHKPAEKEAPNQEHKQREHSVVGKTMVKVFNGILNQFKEKPVTKEELIELQKRVVKYRLKADIEKSKATIRKAKENRFGSISSRKTTTRRDSSDDISSVLRGSVKGSTEHTFFTQRNHKDIRKAFYG